MFGKMFAWKEIVRKGYGKECYGSKKKNSDSFSSFSKLWNSNALSRFNGDFSRDNLPNIKDGAYVISFDEYADTGIY